MCDTFPNMYVPVGTPFHLLSKVPRMMLTTPVFLWSLNIVLDTLGHVAFKFAARSDTGVAVWRQIARRPWLWVGVSCFVLEFVVWLAFLSLVPLSEGVLVGSFNIVVLMLVGRWLFVEHLTPLRLTGIGLVALGVGLVGMG